MERPLTFVKFLPSMSKVYSKGQKKEYEQKERRSSQEILLWLSCYNVSNLLIQADLHRSLAVIRIVTEVTLGGIQGRRLQIVVEKLVHQQLHKEGGGGWQYLICYRVINHEPQFYSFTLFTPEVEDKPSLLDDGHMSLPTVGWGGVYYWSIDRLTDWLTVNKIWIGLNNEYSWHWLVNGYWLYHH